MQTNEGLIKTIWKKYSTNPPNKVQVSSIIKKAKIQYVKAKKEYKLGTFISWWTRQYFVKNKK